MPAPFPGALCGPTEIVSFQNKKPAFRCLYGAVPAKDSDICGPAALVAGGIAHPAAIPIPDNFHFPHQTIKNELARRSD